MPTESLTVTVVVHNQGIHFGLSADGNDLLSLLVSKPIPRQQLNTFIFEDLRPMISTIGPWSNGYGMRNNITEISILVSSDNDGLHFAQQPASSVVIEELQPETTALPAPQLDLVMMEEEPSRHTTTADTLLDPNAAEMVTNLHPPLVIADDLPAPFEIPPTMRGSENLSGHVVGLSHEGLGLAAVGTITAPVGPLVTRGRRPKASAPFTTTEVRRNTRTNKYNGFHINQNFDSRTVTSKVLPRIIPSMGSSSTVRDLGPEHNVIPPPTPIPVLQAIGTNQCVVPASELTKEALLAAPSAPTSTNIVSSEDEPRSGEAGDGVAPTSA